MSPSISFASETKTSQRRSSIYAQKKQKMNMTQTLFLCHSARSKLSREAARADHDLRLLVGHANLLDGLMIELANAEQEQERWFNKSLSSTREEEENEVQYEDTIVEEPEPEWQAEDVDTSDDSDCEDEDIKSSETTSTEIDMEYDDEDDSSLALTRTSSRHSPPELTLDGDSDSEDEHMPPSPPNLLISDLIADPAQSLFTSTEKAAHTESMDSHEFYLPSRQQPTLIAAY